MAIDLDGPELRTCNHLAGSPCQLPARGSTVAEAISDLAHGSTRTMSYDSAVRRLESNDVKQMELVFTALHEDDERRKHIMDLVAAYFAANPNGQVRIGTETPRGGRRHGGLRRWGPTFYVKLGTRRHYFPHLTVYMRRENEVVATARRIYVECRCWGADRTPTPRFTTLWEAGA